MKLAVYGAAGRMGRAVVRLCTAAGDLELVGAIEQPEADGLGRDAGDLAGAGHLGVALDAEVSAGLLGADVVVDFSTAGAFERVLRAAVQAGVAVVSGTTRLSAESEALIDKAAERIPVLWAPNMSVGVHVLSTLVEQAARALGDDYDIEIVEAHHNRKTDAPSGTATMLCEVAQRARSDLAPVHGREGHVGARAPTEIGVHALRGGGVIGDHSVHLVGSADRIEITHRAVTRDLFAEGALRAARWIAGRPAGRYELSDTLS